MTAKRDGLAVDFSSMRVDFPQQIDFFGQPERADEDFVKLLSLNTAPVAFENAQLMADRIDYSKDYFSIVSGSFIFGDFLEALIFKKSLAPSKLYITTLGMGSDNVDSIVNIAEYLGCQEVNLIVSHYFAAVERHKLIPYMVKEFRGLNVNLAVLATHCKISLIYSEQGDVMISGSANLSSSDNVEQFFMVHDPAAIEYARQKLDGIMQRFTVYRGLTGELDWPANKNNRSSKAFSAFMRGEVDADG